MDVMAKDRKTDRHKGQPTYLRFHPLLRRQLRKLCERNVSTMTAEIVIAVRNHLAKEGFWPPSEKATG